MKFEHNNIFVIQMYKMCVCASTSAIIELELQCMLLFLGAHVLPNRIFRHT